MSDFVDEALRRIAAVAGVPVSTFAQVERELRAVWGGRTPYLRRQVHTKRPSRVKSEPAQSVKLTLNEHGEGWRNREHGSGGPSTLGA